MPTNIIHTSVSLASTMPKPAPSYPPNSVDAVFMMRARRAFESLIRDLPRDDLSSAVSAPSDFEVVLTAMLAARKLLARTDPDRDPLELARLRGQKARLVLLNKEGGTLSAGETADLLGISRQAVNKRRQSNRLLAVPLGRHGFAYPAWQFTDDGVVPGFEAVLQQLTRHDPWMQARFFLQSSKALGDMRPLDELRKGNVEAVQAAATRYGEHGAV